MGVCLKNITILSEKKHQINFEIRASFNKNDLFSQRIIVGGGHEMLNDIEEATASDWKEQVLEAKKLVVVKFWHPFCRHCQANNPVYYELAGEYGNQLKFTSLNVVNSTENEKLAGKYGVMGTPTFLFFCGERPVNGLVGALPKEDLAQAIEFTLKKHQDCTKKVHH